MKDATSHPEMSPMMLLRARTAAVLLAAALAAPAGACLAQGRDAAQAADATGIAGATGPFRAARKRPREGAVQVSLHPSRDQ
jgi:hypothetical protein